MRRNVFSVRVRDSKEFTVSASRRGEDNTNRCELDSHADTIVGGANCVLLDSNGETATVHSFSDERKPFPDVPIGTIATSWVNPETSEIFVLVFHEALYFGDKLDHTLICPNQLRAYGIIVDDTPRQFNSGSRHSIMVPEEDDLKIPLEMNGVVSYFPSHKPSADELVNCQRIVLSSDISWDPNDLAFDRQERAMTSSDVQVSEVHQNGDGHPDALRCCGKQEECMCFNVVPVPAELV